MPRRKEGHRLLSCRIDGDVYARLEAHCDRNGVTRTDATEEALRMFLEDRETSWLAGLARDYGPERIERELASQSEA